MRKTKIVLIIALALSALMLFSSCSGLFPSNSKNLKLHEIVDNSYNVDNSVVYSNGKEIWDAQGASVETCSESLVVFQKKVDDGFMSFDRMMVYNAKTDTIVYEITESLNTSATIRLYSFGNSDFFVVSTTTYSMNDLTVDYDNYTVEKKLYDNNGSIIAIADGSASVKVIEDYLLFDEKYYKMNAEGVLEHAFDHPDFGKVLSESPDFSSDEYYFVGNSSYISNSIEVYDKNLNYVATYALPSYSDISLNTCVILDNGNIFVQYFCTVDEHSEDYDIYTPASGSSPAKKSNVVTLVVDVATGEQKEIDCNYVIMSSAMDSTMKNIYKYDTLVSLAPIVNKRADISVNSLKLAVINNDGSFKFVDGLNGKVAIPVDAAGQDRWIVENVESRSFLMRDDGSIVGEITGYSNFNNKYILSNGKIFNYDLAELYNYENEGLDVVNVFENSILFRDNDGRYVIYANGVSNTLWFDGLSKSLVEYRGESFIVFDNSNELAPRYLVYNAEGTVILTIDASGLRFDVGYVYSGEDYQMIRASFYNDTEYTTDYVYYIVY